jgi:hypothetical protein
MTHSTVPTLFRGVKRVRHSQRQRAGLVRSIGARLPACGGSQALGARRPLLIMRSERQPVATGFRASSNRFRASSGSNVCHRLRPSVPCLFHRNRPKRAVSGRTDHRERRSTHQLLAALRQPAPARRPRRRAARSSARLLRRDERLHGSVAWRWWRRCIFMRPRSPASGCGRRSRQARRRRQATARRRRTAR